ncbi:MAG TPA: MlaD family protein [Solirubrobacteraceae bacterium]|jgi:virulence factor Mce-like protein|nr:MlaD family protein [Solirubrobacteraceae bacterium]
MPRRRRASIASSPVLIGAATTLVLIVAVFLAYNANNGLPFVPTYALNANVPSAANLVRGNDVRVGGARVGIVSTIAPVRHPDGSVTAELGLKLQTRVRPLPVDSTLIVRSRSALGLKYLEITRGHSSRGFPDGASIPLANATPEPVEIDQVLNAFNDPTRAASRINLFEFGNGLAGRGGDLNLALENLNPLLPNLTTLMGNLANPRTQLGRLFVALERSAALVAPVAETQARLFDNLDTTFRALAGVARPFIQDSISGGPPALNSAIRSFPVIRPFLLNTQHLFAELRPGVHALRRAAPDLSAALHVGTPVLRRSVELSQRLKPAFAALQRLAADPLAAQGVKQLSNTATILNPTVAFLTPAQTVCNYVTLWFRNVASLLSEGDTNGTWQRFIIVTTPQGPNNEGGPSSVPANGPGQDNFLHANPYPNTASPGQTPRECEAANEPYLVGRQVIGNVPGDQGTNHDTTTIQK